MRKLLCVLAVLLSAVSAGAREKKIVQKSPYETGEIRRHHFREVLDKKFIFGYLIPSFAATTINAEGTSCLHDGFGGQLLRHEPCGRRVSYPLVFGLKAVEAWGVYTMKRYSDEDREAGLRPHWTTRYWFRLGLAYNAIEAANGIWLLRHPAYATYPSVRP